MTDGDDCGVLHNRQTTIITTQSRPRYVWWRDLVLLLLVAAVLLLVLEGRADRRTIEQVRSDAVTAQTQRTEIREQLEDVLTQVADTQAAADRKDAEIARLNALLQQAGVDPGKPLTDSNGDGDDDLGSSGVVPTARVTPSTSRTPATSPPSTTASPRPTATPTASPTPAPTPSPCAVELLGLCLLP